MGVSARSLAVVFLATAPILGAGEAPGAYLIWLPSFGDWSNPPSWSGGASPTAADTVYIVNGGIADVTTNGDICYALALGGSSSGTVIMTGGSLQVVGESIGDAGTGVFLQSGGTNATALYLGYHPGGNGTYDLSNGSVSATVENIGYGATVPIVLSTVDGNAVFDTDGNTLTLAGDLSGPGPCRKLARGC